MIFSEDCGCLQSMLNFFPFPPNLSSIPNHAMSSRCPPFLRTCPNQARSDPNKLAPSSDCAPSGFCLRVGLLLPFTSLLRIFRASFRYQCATCHTNPIRKRPLFFSPPTSPHYVTIRLRRAFLPPSDCQKKKNPEHRALHIRTPSLFRR